MQVEGEGGGDGDRGVGAWAGIKARCKSESPVHLPRVQAAPGAVTPRLPRDCLIRKDSGIDPRATIFSPASGHCSRL